MTMTLKPPHETFVRTEAELTQLWEHMMGPGGFARRSIWHVFFDADGQMCPVIVPIDDIPQEPDALGLGSLADIVGDVTRASAIASVAVLLSRPGEQAMTPADRRWARAIHAAFASTIRLWPIHLATTDRVQVFAPDDLIAA
jgi:hypothetical protein